MTATISVRACIKVDQFCFRRIQHAPLEFFVGLPRRLSAFGAEPWQMSCHSDGSFFRFRWQNKKIVQSREEALARGVVNGTDRRQKCINDRDVAFFL